MQLDAEFHQGLHCLRQYSTMCIAGSGGDIIKSQLKLFDLGKTLSPATYNVKCCNPFYTGDPYRSTFANSEDPDKISLMLHFTGFTL